MTITAADLRGCHMEQLMQLDGSDRQGRWAAWHSRCVEHPRLTRWGKSWRRTRTAEVTLLVDGQPVADLAAAAEALNRPPAPAAAAPLQGELL